MVFSSPLLCSKQGDQGLSIIKARLHDIRFGYGTLKFWHADPHFLVRLMRLHNNIYDHKILGSARLKWERFP